MKNKKVLIEREDLLRFLEDAGNEKLLLLLYVNQEILYDFIDDWLLLQENKMHKKTKILTSIKAQKIPLEEKL